MTLSRLQTRSSYAQVDSFMNVNPNGCVADALLPGLGTFASEFRSTSTLHGCADLPSASVQGNSYASFQEYTLRWAAQHSGEAVKVL